MAYAFTTTQLYQFAELVRKVLAVSTMTIVLLVVFGGTHLLAKKLLVPYIPRSDFFALAMASIIMSFLFHPLRFRVQNLVDRVFFTERYDQMQRLRDLSRQVLSSADREELMDTLFEKLGEIGFGSISILLKDPQKSVFQIRKIVGGGTGSDGFFLKPDSLLVQYLREEKKELVRDEVSRRILADWERQALIDEMDILQAEIAFPLFSTRRRALFGIITIGNSDLGYSSYMGRNIFWLKSVIDNAGIMFDNFYHHDFANALIPYVGRTWADEMRRNKEGFRERLTGHRTWVSVLMVDIRHFTTMSARMDPTQVVSLLKEFRLAVAPIVYRYQGAIDKFIGDAVMIVFGLPILHTLPNPDRNAVECAHAIMQEIVKLNQTKLKNDPIAIGIGVSSGEVIAGNVDSGDRVEYTVIGDAANMVARLEDLAQENTILISPATYGRVKDFVNVNVWPPQKLTGFEEPVPIYELNSIKKPGALTIPVPPPSVDESYGPMAANQ
jgi:class 3 adenylate cyclase